MGASGGLQVAGLDWFGARAYDQLHAIDPLGLRAVTAADLHEYRDGNNGAMAATPRAALSVFGEQGKW